MITFHIITIFPNIFEPYFNTSIIGRAQQKKKIKIKIHNLRDFTADKHKKVALRQGRSAELSRSPQGNREPRRTIDDKPYGGGPGMILKIEPIYRSIFKNKKLKIKNKKLSRIILLTPAGKQFDQKMAQRFSKLEQIIFICGHYEGIDARIEKFVDEKISTGPYVLTGGELPAMTIIDAITRLVPGVIRPESLQEETFTSRINTNLTTNATNIREISGRISVNSREVEYPQYTRPEVLTISEKSAKIKKLKVPKVLLSGNHQAIKEWRKQRTI